MIMPRSLPLGAYGAVTLLGPLSVPAAPPGHDAVLSLSRTPVGSGGPELTEAPEGCTAPV